ncbi:MAG: hypothetical protein ACPGL0_12560 [Limisphaerales bacterium]|jgi:hypothetical protein|nr:hypothetical protein [Verrucomicrobiota bacterium]
MNTLEKELLERLNALHAAVEQLAAKQGRPNLLELFESIESQASQLPGDTSPTLLHYLSRKSYEKARLFLMGRDDENQAGNCHGHRA